MGVRIEVGEGESIGKALRRFKLLCDRAGIRYQLNKHEYRRKPCEERERRRYKAWAKMCRVSYLKRRELGLVPREER